MKKRTFTKVERPAPGALFNPWRQQMHGLAVFTIIIAAVGMGLLLVSTTAAVGAFIVAGIGALAVVFLFYCVWVADRHLSRLSQGEFLVHWVYSPAEWQRFLASPGGLKPVNRLLAPSVGAITGGVCATAVTFGYLDAQHRFPPLNNDPGYALELASIFGAAAIGWACGMVWRDRRTKSEPCLKPETYISRDGLYCAGHYYYWGAFTPVLWIPWAEVVKRDPPVIEFDFYKKYPIRVPILIPKGQLEKAEKVVRELMADDSPENEELSTEGRK